MEQMIELIEEIKEDFATLPDRIKKQIHYSDKLETALKHAGTSKMLENAVTESEMIELINSIAGLIDKHINKIEITETEAMIEYLRHFGGKLVALLQMQEQMIIAMQFTYGFLNAIENGKI